MALLAGLALTLVVSLEIGTEQFITNFAAESTHSSVANVDVAYIENGVLRSASAAPITSSVRTLNPGWYYVSGSVTVNNRAVKVIGDVNLILEDDCHLQVINAWNTWSTALEVIGSNSLTIFGQAGGTGRLTVEGGQERAGIGGGYGGGVVGTVTINGGTVEATGGESAAGIGGDNEAAGGTITITGGIVTATGGIWAASIGGGRRGAGGTVTISGGTVESTGKDLGAGIGGGRDAAGGTVTISGGIVTATGGWRAAGIGGGTEAAGGTVTISGGIVTATGGVQGGSGIGGGMYGAGGTVVITGGSVKAAGKDGGEDIGHGVTHSNSGSLTNGAESVYRNTLQIIPPQENVAITRVIIDNVTSSYGLNDVVTDNTSKVYFYLPASSSDEEVEEVVLRMYCFDYVGYYKRPAESDPVTPGRELVMVECTVREVSSVCEFLCGSSDCYQLLDMTTGNLKTGVGSCGLCPPTLSNATDSICTLLECAAREATSDYTFPCGPSDCYQLLEPSTGNLKTGVGSCGASTLCPPTLSNATDGICTLLECSARETTSGYTFPCGTSDCYQLLEPSTGNLKTGVGSCGASTLCPPTLSNATDGICKFLECAARETTSGYTFPCGTSDCYQLLEPTTGSLKTGVGSCGVSTSCPPTLSNATDGICALLECAERETTSGYTFPCGTSDCYQLLEPTTGSLKTEVGSCGVSTSCPPTLSNATDGICALLECAARETTSGYTFPCGTSDCYQQPNSTGKVSSCGRHCPVNISAAGVHSGTCEYLVCSKRIRDDVLGCGSDCYYFPDYRRMASSECVGECLPNYILGGNKLQCEPKSCTIREWSRGCGLPSDDPETEKCFVHNKTCVSACPEGYSPEDTLNACVADYDNQSADNARSRTLIPWWVIAVVVSVVVVSIALVIVVFVVHKRTHKGSPKDERSQQQQGVLFDNDIDERASKEHTGESVVLMEKGSAKAFRNDNSVEFREIHSHQTEMDVMPDCETQNSALENSNKDKERKKKQKE